MIIKFPIAIYIPTRREQRRRMQEEDEDPNYTITTSNGGTAAVSLLLALILCVYVCHPMHIDWAYLMTWCIVLLLN